MIAFGTGRKVPVTNTTPVSYANATQDLYGIWDWNLSAWNSNSMSQYASLAATATATGLAAPYTLSQSNLQKQQFTINTTTGVANGDRDIAANAAVCWRGSSTCVTGNTQFGWYVDLPGTNTDTTTSPTTTNYEQVVFNPQLLGAAFVVNSTLAATNSVLSCTPSTDTGWTYALSIMGGGAFTNFFPQYHDTFAGGVQTNATGTSFPVVSADGSTWLVYQTVKDTPETQKVNLPPNTQTNRLTWIELR
jgi:type IV pilus assembly protein PilY1